MLSQPADAAGQPAPTPPSIALAADSFSDEPVSDDERADHAAVDDGDDHAAPPEDASAPDSGQADQAKDGLPGELTADIALVSDYIFRGITNTDHNPAVQGGLIYTADIGLPYAQPYLGFWGSNVDFDDGGEASVEIDLMFGFSGTIADIDWDLGGLYYTYPGAASDLNYDYWEIPLQLSYAVDDQWSIFAQYSYSPDYFANSGSAHYLLAGARWQQPIHSMMLGVEATTGHQWIADNAAYGAEDYQDWRVALSLTIGKITFAAAYTDTNLGKGQCFSGTNQCEPRATLSLAASF
jgi:uncharacterized protein (TIGR02001 family)